MGVGWLARVQMRQRGVAANVLMTTVLLFLAVAAALFLDGLGFSESTVVIVFVLIVLVVNLITDIIYSIIDPRISLE
jgi:ABC-type microcin C transport system permease subunit YejB